MTKISILLPTRKRTTACQESLQSLLDNATHKNHIEILLGIDEDDSESLQWFNSDQFAKFIDKYPKTCYRIWTTPRLGYLNLNQYVNHLAGMATGTHLMFWNDDAHMLTKNWDKHIHNNKDFWGCLRMPCVNMEHPFALFPIIPKSWIGVFGCVSPVNHSDWWVYMVTQPLRRLIDIPVHVQHNRADVNGENNDSTFADQSYSLDGQSPHDMRDYSHPQRQQDLTAWRETLMLYGYPHKRK